VRNQNVKRWIVLGARGLVATEWLHEGLYNKVLGGDPRHEDIVASVPGLSRSQAIAGMRALGLAETAIAGWVLSGGKRKESALLQTVLVVIMNTGGLLFAGKHIPNHRRLILRSAIFILLVWVAAQDTKLDE
jgi:DoxX-like family